MPTTDYRKLYDDFWNQADGQRREHHGNDATIVDQILSLCGGGRYLDVGCGMGGMVRALLRKGVDAHGVDIAQRPVQALSMVAPGRSHLGSLLDLPFPDESFDTLLCTHVLECLEESDVARALQELRRVTRRSLFLTIATTPDCDNRWRRTVHGRDWWENALFQAGFRKHPRSQTQFPYESLEHEQGLINVVVEKIPHAALARYPLEALAPERDLHMDMLRETGRRADAHIARYHLACTFVRPGDVVLDAACGLGYGSAVLASCTPAGRIIGIDASRYAVEYARANYALPGVEFREADVADLGFLPDHSVDYVVSMETLEHLPDPESFLAEIRRVLRPGGRVVVSVPNEWVDKSGKDPNPAHLHVYTWPKLRAQLERCFVPEKLYAQTAGGGLKLSDSPRRLREVPLEEHSETPAEWWLAVAMKDPVGAPREGYRETSFPHHDHQAYHITAFGRDYDNPWLVKGMVSIGMRMTDPHALERMARKVLETSRPGSADAGAALCVLGYRLLDDAGLSVAKTDKLLETIEAYHASADDTAHAWRWRISNQYLAGLLYLATGRLEQAREAFLKCGRMDCLRFSPLLATKTVDALFHAGLIAASAGDLESAAANWQAALREAQRVLSGDWLNIWGSPEKVVEFGLPEATQVLDLATRCAYGLVGLQHWPARPGWAWVQAFRNSALELLYWRRLSAERYGTIAVQERELIQQNAAINWLRSETGRQQQELEAVGARLAAAEGARDWERAEAQRLYAELADLRAAFERQEEAFKSREKELADRLAFVENQRDWKRSEAQRLYAELADLRAWSDKLDSMHAEQCRQSAQLREQLDGIYNSTGWKLLQIAYRVRFGLMPLGSRRDRFGRWCMHVQRRFRFHARQGPRALLTAMRKALGRNWRKAQVLASGEARQVQLPAIPERAGFAADVPGLVSVVLPVYNQADLLRESIESVLAQTYPHFELIIVNDGSKDDVARVLNEYAGHPKVRILTQENQKLPKALSNGFDFARGEFWTWTSADNLMEPQQLEKQVAFLRANPEAAMVYCDYLAIDDRGQPLRDPSFRPQNRRSPDSPEIHLPRETTSLNTTQDNFIGACFMYRGWAGRLLGDYVPILGVEDYDYWMRMNALFRISHLGTDDLLYRYRVHDNTLNARAAEHQIYQRAQRLMWYEQRRGSYYQRPWKIYVDDPTYEWLQHLNISGHTVRRLTADNAMAREREETVVIVRADTLERLDERQLPKTHCLAVWCDSEPSLPYRLGHLIQRLAHLCLAPDAATADRLALYTRQVFEVAPGQAAFNLVLAFAKNDIFARQTLPAEDCTRALPRIYCPTGRRLRVLLQAEDFVQGGLERVILDVAAVLDPAEFEVSLLVLGRQGPMAEQARRAGLRILTLPDDGREAAYRRLLTEERIDVVNAHYSLFGAQIADEMGVPFIQTVHNAYVWSTPEDIAAHRQADAHTTAYLCVSSSVAGYAEQRLGLPANKMLVAANGIDLSAIDAARERVDRARERARLGFADDDFVFLCPASISAVKGQLHLVRALAVALEKNPHIRVALLGRVSDDEYTDMVRREISRLKLEEKVRLLGYHEDPFPFLLASDAFIQPSFVEGWSLALAEAIYAGLPCVATDTGAAREILSQTGGIVVKHPFRSLLEHDHIQFAVQEKCEQPAFVEELAAAMVATAADPEPPALSDALREAIDRQEAYQAYAHVFRWVAFKGHAAAVRPLVWELHRSRGSHRLTSDPLRRGGRRRAGGFEAFQPSEQSVNQVCERARAGKGAVVFLRSIDWSQWLFQRPHHLARRLARKGYTVVYDDSDRFTGFSGFKEIEPNLYLFRGTPDLLHRIPDPILWSFCYNYHLKDGFAPGSPVIYDLIDDFAVHPYDLDLMKRNHQRALAEASVVAYVARHLESLLQDRPDRLYLPNGVEDDLFADETVPMPHDPRMRQILKEGKPIAGYYGALAQWFDYDLLEKVARRRPDWNFVLIGVDYDGSLEDRPMLKCPNVHWIGPRDYATLPAYLRAFTVATIPFAINDITLATSPLKLYEYFAGGKPVITSPMPECMAFPEVHIVRSEEEFAVALDKAREEGQNAAFRARLREIGRLNSWTERVREVEEALAAAAAKEQTR